MILDSKWPNAEFCPRSDFGKLCLKFKWYLLGLERTAQEE